MPRLSEELPITSNPAVYWKIRRRVVLECAYCAPHRGMDNEWSRHARSDRYKSIRRGQRATIRTIRDPRFWMKYGTREAQAAPRIVSDDEILTCRAVDPDA